MVKKFNSPDYWYKDKTYNSPKCWTGYGGDVGVERNESVPGKCEVFLVERI